VTRPLTGRRPPACSCASRTTACHPRLPFMRRSRVNAINLNGRIIGPVLALVKPLYAQFGKPAFRDGNSASKSHYFWLIVQKFPCTSRSQYPHHTETPGSCQCEKHHGIYPLRAGQDHHGTEKPAGSELTRHVRSFLSRFQFQAGYHSSPRKVTFLKNKKPPHQHMADRNGLLFFPHDSKGKASCVPPEKHWNDLNNRYSLTP
jgi:hypothetical protein